MSDRMPSATPSEKSKEDDYSDPERLSPVVTTQEGEQKFNKLGWKKLTICLIVEAIALGSLSIPSAFATVGMVPGIFLSIVLGLVAIYTAHVVGQVKLKYPEINDYADAVKLIWGQFGYNLTAVMFILLLVLLVAGHTLTGTIAWVRIVDDTKVCALAWSAISAILLFALALPPSFAEFAILGYIDFVSIIVAIFVTIIATGVEAQAKPGGIAGVEWSVWAPEGTTFYGAFLATTNIIFAYSFAVCQFSFMSEMHTPKDYVKSIWALGLIEMFIYTLTGALIYAFVGNDVSSPALLSASKDVSRIAFGIALPVIFISGSINSTVVGRYIIGRVFPNSPIKYTNTKMGWIVWVALLAALTLFAWIVAEAIPFFNDLLGIISSLFISGFSFYFPALFWFQLIKEGKWNATWKNIGLSITNALCLIIGVIVLICGTYASIKDIMVQYEEGNVRGSFTCDASAYD